MLKNTGGENFLGVIALKSKGLNNNTYTRTFRQLSDYLERLKEHS